MNIHEYYRINVQLNVPLPQYPPVNPLMDKNHNFFWFNLNIYFVLNWSIIFLRDVQPINGPITGLGAKSLGVLLNWRMPRHFNSCLSGGVLPIQGVLHPSPFTGTFSSATNVPGGGGTNEALTLFFPGGLRAQFSFPNLKFSNFYFTS